MAAYLQILPDLLKSEYVQEWFVDPQVKTQPETQPDFGSPEESNMAKTGTLSTFFVSQGSPMTAVDGCNLHNFFLNRTKRYSTRPKAILVISGHWNTREPSVLVSEKSRTLHDFHGLPELHHLQYTPPGVPDVARRVKSLLQGAGFETVIEESKRRIDLGAWTPLSLMYPEADIPVLQLSIQCNKDGVHHYKMGQALAPLRDGVMIFASGASTHNMRELDFSTMVPAPWAKSFDDWLDDVRLNKHEELMHWEKAPYALKAHPELSHLLPALVAFGAAGERCDPEKIYEEYVWRLTMGSYEFEPPRTAQAAS